MPPRHAFARSSVRQRRLCLNSKFARLVLASALATGVSTLSIDRLSYADDATGGPASEPASAAMTPLERVNATPRGELKNPYAVEGDTIQEGHKLFFSYGCSGCHGGTGGGGMCPPVNGDVWFYGLADDTLFRLVTLGSVALQGAGFQRLGGKGLQMPAFSEIIKNEDDLWKILTWVRSVYKGDPKKKTW
jgi:mono/diheme cytochrome c family protein